MSDFRFRYMVRFWMLLAVLALTGGALAQAQEIGEVTYVQGVASAQRPGGEARFLAKGDTISQGEVINTSERGYAVVGLKDGTKITLRSNTAFAVNEFSREPGRENLAMNLLRGGLRAFTGLISKARPTNARLTTPTATVGIRGTEFDARICGADCRRESEFAKPAPPAPARDPVVARVAVLNGAATAVARDGAARPLAKGAAVYTGEAVRTDAGSQAVLAFRDQTKVTLLEKTDFRLEDVRMAGPPAQGNFVVRLVTGGLRAFTGLIGKSNRGNVKFITPTATVGIRGTGLDLRQVADNVYLFTWDGSAALEADGKEVVVDAGRAGVSSRERGVLELLSEVPEMFRDDALRPDRIEVDFDGLFAVRRFEEAAPGLYVLVRSGFVNLDGLDLGPFETGFLADGSRVAVRIEPMPGFLFNDPFPLPDNADLRPLRLIELVGPGRLSASDQCLLQ